MASVSAASGRWETASPERIEVVNSFVIHRRFYDCFLCKRGFTTAQALDGHMNIHRSGKRRSKAVVPGRPEGIHRSYWPYSRPTSKAYASMYSRKPFMFIANNDEMDLRLGRRMQDHYGNESGCLEEKGSCDAGGLDLELRLGPVVVKCGQSTLESSNE